MTNREKLIELKNWKEVTLGLYRYVVAACACYELHILYHSMGTDIMTAKASLFLVGSWHNEHGNNWFERECMLSERPVFECLEAAANDWEEHENDG